MTKPKLKLTIVTQDRVLTQTEAESLTAPTVSGEVTILPGHVALFSRLIHGELLYRNQSDVTSFAVSKGFLDVSPDNHVTIIVDNAVAAREISLEKAQAAVKAAHETMSKTTDQRELLLAEASLKQALLEIKIAEKTRRRGL